MIWLILGVAYGLVGAGLFRVTYRDARRKEERKPLYAQRPAWKDALGCAGGGLVWPIPAVLVGFLIFCLWLGFRQDKM